MKKVSRKKTLTADVLYQKLGGRWFAFSVVENEVYFTSFSPEKILKVSDMSNKNQRKSSRKKAAPNASKAA